MGELAQTRLWTLAEATAALPAVREALATARAATQAMRDAEEQLQDLRIVWGDQVLAAACPDHEEWLTWRKQHAQARQAVEGAMTAFDAIGCQVKDVEAGLVDFPGRLGKEDVLLCWRDGESRIGFYHAASAGFAGRKPIPDAPSA